MDKTDTLLNEIIAHLEEGGIVPYLGPGETYERRSGQVTSTLYPIL